VDERLHSNVLIKLHFVDGKVKVKSASKELVSSVTDDEQRLGTGQQVKGTKRRPGLALAIPSIVLEKREEWSQFT